MDVEVDVVRIHIDVHVHRNRRLRLESCQLPSVHHVPHVGVVLQGMLEVRLTVRQVLLEVSEVIVIVSYWCVVVVGWWLVVVLLLLGRVRVLIVQRLNRSLEKLVRSDMMYGFHTMRLLQARRFGGEVHQIDFKLLLLFR